MTCFPLDNTGYEAVALGAWCGTRTRGVFSGDGHYGVTANGDMTVTVSPGLAWLKAAELWGVNMFEINSTVLQIATADGSLTRYAAICLRLDKNLNVGSIAIKYGPYGTNQTLDSLPLPEQNSLDYDEIYPAAIRIRAGATEILPSDIFDLRTNETYCGIMRDGVTGIPTQQLYDQWHNWFNGFQADTQEIFENYSQLLSDMYMQYLAELAVHENNATAAYDAYVQRMHNYETTATADWEAWVATLTDILDEQVAGNHELRIEALEGRTPSAIIGTVSTTSATTSLYPLCFLGRSSWAYGIGGAGLGPAGGTNVRSISAEFDFEGDGNVTVIAPESFSAFTTINRLSDSTVAFLSSDPAEVESLFLKIFKED